MSGHPFFFFSRYFGYGRSTIELPKCSSSLSRGSHILKSLFSPKMVLVVHILSGKEIPLHHKGILLCQVSGSYILKPSPPFFFSLVINIYVLGIGGIDFRHRVELVCRVNNVNKSALNLHIPLGGRQHKCLCYSFILSNDQNKQIFLG